MQSEIPQLEVITAIADAETEDFVAQLLFSQGWSIIFRAIDAAELKQTLMNRGVQLRTVVIYRTDLPGLTETDINELTSPTTTFICLDGVEVNAHKIMVQIRSQLRLPLIQQVNPLMQLVRSERAPQPEMQIRKIVTVTGTTGAPGRTHLAFHLGQYLSWQRSVQLIDADLRSPSLAYLQRSLAKVSPSRCKLMTLDLADKPVTLPLPAESTKDISIVDIGALPPVAEVVNDRRWQACLINNILEVSTSLIYVVRTSGTGLLRLESFISEFPILLRKIPILYVLNQSSNTREDRAIEQRFMKLTAGEERFVLPTDHRPISAPKSKSGPFDLARGGSRIGKEIGKIAAIVG